jgi:4-hydroxythreonine-4-phosphate dehydrogenase
MTNTQSDPIKIGITHGDFNGIGYEIILKVMNDKRLLELFTPIIYGSSKIASYYRKAFNLDEVNFNLIKKADYANPKKPNIINIYGDEVKVEIGNISKKAGELAFLALERAIEDLNWGKLDALVTAPISKSNIQSDRFRFSGHSEYLASKFNVEDHLMLMVSGNLRIGIITGHIPIKKVSDMISADLILAKIRVMEKSLRMDFNINKPKVAVLGLNPHAGDNGLIGTEEEEFIEPAIKKANDLGILAYGPYPADGFFGSSNYCNFDGILAMYHDQGMLPFKTFGFEQGVNFTAGLPIVRTSPAHGTAFDIAGKNIASPDSFRHALYLAIDIHKNRKLYEELTKNPLDPSGSRAANNDTKDGQQKSFLDE